MNNKKNLITALHFEIAMLELEKRSTDEAKEKLERVMR